MNSKYSDFEQALNTDLTISVTTVVEAAGTRTLSITHLEVLLDSLTSCFPDMFSETTHLTGAGIKDPGYGAEFDMVQEVNEQIRVVRSLRNLIIEPVSGSIKEGYTARDAKELIGSSSTMLASLMKFHDKIINQDRVRAVEQATIEAVRTLPKEAQDTFFTTLETSLAAIK